MLHEIYVISALRAQLMLLTFHYYACLTYFTIVCALAMFCLCVYDLNWKGGQKMKFSFDWNFIAAGAPYVTVSELALAFNAPAVVLLGNPENVVAGFDEKRLAIGIKRYSGEENVKSYKFYSRMKNGWVRIGCKDFVKYLSSISGISFSPAKKYVAQFDKEEGVLFIELMSGQAKDEAYER